MCFCSEIKGRMTQTKLLYKEIREKSPNSNKTNEYSLFMFQKEKKDILAKF